MRLIVVVGYHQDSRSSKPFPVYAGRDSAEAEAAMEASNALVFDVIRNPTTVRKRRRAGVPLVVEVMSAAEIMAAIIPESEKTAEMLAAEAEALAAPVVAEAPPAQPDVQPSSGVSGKRGRAA
jgi:hypothetical protein